MKVTVLRKINSHGFPFSCKQIKKEKLFIKLRL